MDDPQLVMQVSRRLQGGGPITSATMTLDASNLSFPVVLIEARHEHSSERGAVIVALAEAVRMVANWESADSSSAVSSSSVMEGEVGKEEEGREIFEKPRTFDFGSMAIEEINDCFLETALKLPFMLSLGADGALVLCSDPAAWRETHSAWRQHHRRQAAIIIQSCYRRHQASTVHFIKRVRSTAMMQNVQSLTKHRGGQFKDDIRLRYADDDQHEFVVDKDTAAAEWRAKVHQVREANRGARKFAIEHAAIIIQSSARQMFAMRTFAIKCQNQARHAMEAIEKEHAASPQNAQQEERLRRKSSFLGHVLKQPEISPFQVARADGAAKVIQSCYKEYVDRHKRMHSALLVQVALQLQRERKTTKVSSSSSSPRPLSASETSPQSLTTRHNSLVNLFRQDTDLAEQRLEGEESSNSDDSRASSFLVLRQQLLNMRRLQLELRRPLSSRASLLEAFHNVIALFSPIGGRGSYFRAPDVLRVVATSSPRGISLDSKTLLSRCGLIKLLHPKWYKSTFEQLDCENNHMVNLADLVYWHNYDREEQDRIILQEEDLRMFPTDHLQYMTELLFPVSGELASVTLAREKKQKQRKERMLMEEKRTRMEIERMRVEEERMRVEEERMRVEEERMRVEKERLRVEKESLRAEEERVTAEKEFAEAELMQAEEERMRLEKNQTVDENRKTNEVAARAEETVKTKADTFNQERIVSSKCLAEVTTAASATPGTLGPKSSLVSCCTKEKDGTPLSSTGNVECVSSESLKEAESPATVLLPVSTRSKPMSATAVGNNSQHKKSLSRNILRAESPSELRHEDWKMTRDLELADLERQGEGKWGIIKSPMRSKSPLPPVQTRNRPAVKKRKKDSLRLDTVQHLFEMIQRPRSAISSVGSCKETTEDINAITCQDLYLEEERPQSVSSMDTQKFVGNLRGLSQKRRMKNAISLYSRGSKNTKHRTKQPRLPALSASPQKANAGGTTPPAVFQDEKIHVAGATLPSKEFYRRAWEHSIQIKRAAALSKAKQDRQRKKRELRRKRQKTQERETKATAEESVLSLGQTFEVMQTWLNRSYLRVKDGFATVDLDGNGELDHGEFILLLQKLGLRMATHQVSAVFQAIDTDNSKTISLNELEKGMRRFRIMERRRRYGL